MNQLCPRCRHVNSPANSYCSQCGAPLDGTRILDNQRSRAHNGWWWVLITFVIAVCGALWVGAFFFFFFSGPSRDQSAPRLIAAPSTQSIQSNTSGGAAATTTSVAAQPAPAEQTSLTAAQHLAEARRALSAADKRKSDAALVASGPWAAARWHLSAVKAGEKEYAEAQRLLTALTKREREIAAAAAERAKLERAVAAAESDGPSNYPAADAVDLTAEKSASELTTGGSSSGAEDANTFTLSKTQAPHESSPGGGSGYYTNRTGNRVRSPTFSRGGVPAGATARCRDGSYSFSQNRRGTCSHHGGVAQWL